MPAKNLNDYIEEMQRRGYSIDQIKRHLKIYGQSPDAPSQAAQAPPRVRHDIHLSPSALIGTAIIGLGFLIVVIALLFFNSHEEKKLLDLSISLKSQAASPGEYLKFSYDIVSFGSEKRYDVVMSYSILDLDGRVLGFRTETVAIDTRLSMESHIRIPESLESGSYQFEAAAQFGRQKAVASEGFKIIRESRTDAAPLANLDCDDDDACTRDREVAGSCINEPISPCCGDGVCSPGEQCPADCMPSADPVQESPQHAEAEPSGLPADYQGRDAAEAYSACSLSYDRGDCLLRIKEKIKDAVFCAELSSKSLKESCFIILAKNTGQKSYCLEILTDQRRDRCYAHFVALGDYSICEEITEKYLSDSCKQLASLEQLKQQD